MSKQQLSMQEKIRAIFSDFLLENSDRKPYDGDIYKRIYENFPNSSLNNFHQQWNKFKKGNPQFECLPEASILRNNPCKPEQIEKVFNNLLNADINLSPSAGDIYVEILNDDPSMSAGTFVAQCRKLREKYPEKFECLMSTVSRYSICTVGTRLLKN